MSQKFIKNLVIVLSSLIIIAFLTLIYGMYLKISSLDKYTDDSPFVFSPNMDKNEEIKNIEVIDNNKLLILIENNSSIKGLIYDIKKKKIITLIKK